LAVAKFVTEDLSFLCWKDDDFIAQNARERGEQKMCGSDTREWGNLNEYQNKVDHESIF